MKKTFVRASGNVWYEEYQRNPVFISGVISTRKSTITFEIECSECHKTYWDVYNECPHCGKLNTERRG